MCKDEFEMILGSCAIDAQTKACFPELQLGSIMASLPIELSLVLNLGLSSLGYGTLDLCNLSFQVVASCKVILSSGTQFVDRLMHLFLLL